MFLFSGEILEISLFKLQTITRIARVVFKQAKILTDEGKKTFKGKLKKSCSGYTENQYSN